jgi:hypothetical protein
LQALGFEFKYATLEAALAALNPKPVTAPVATGATGAAGVAPEETPAVATAGVSEQAAAPATEDVAEQVKA